MTRRRPRNPYIGALWAVGIGLIVLGAAGYVWASWLSWYPSSGAAVPLADFAQGAGSDIALVGLGTLVGLQFLLRSLRARDRAPATPASSP
ncbi:hypothetical protein [Homoserinimonas sp. OAct 916]|uniref:hypothetical protein n=1 Tax=Homoserinimonas sp. OAct 916 TaxID=2211450 RepID=UPI000DBE6547|nr:hypothetical protein [Homoserinimonas sp. OAct 916]